MQAVKEHPEDAREWAYLEAAYYWTKQYEECYQVAKEAIANFLRILSFIASPVMRAKNLESTKKRIYTGESVMNWIRGCWSLYTPLHFCREEFEEFDKAYEAWMRIADILNERRDEINVKFPLRKAEECKAKMGKVE